MMIPSRLSLYEGAYQWTVSAADYTGWDKFRVEEQAPVTVRNAVTTRERIGGGDAADGQDTCR